MEQRQLFGTSGIRGYTNKDITPQLALEIAMSFGAWLGECSRVAVGRDTRHGAEALASAALAGLSSVGVEPIDCGCLPTPALAAYTRENGLSGCIMITGSHMPPERIGIIPMTGQGAYLHSELSSQVEDLYRSGRYRAAMVPAKRMYPVKRAVDALDSYMEHLLALSGKGDISRSDFKVLCDPGNGTGAGILAELLKELGCQIVEINGEQKGIPDRPAEPRGDSINEARMLVKERNCDMGACLDLDSDRVIFVDEKGEPVSEDVVGIIFADSVFKDSGGIMVTPINSSGLVEWFCRERGVELIYCRVGQPETVRTINELDASFSYEESGKYYFAKEVNWCDGILATAKMLEIMARTGKKLSELAAAYPKYYQEKERVQVPENKIEVVTQKLIENLWLIPGEPLLIERDGLKLIYDDDSWLLIRASGTEPLIRVMSDSPWREKAKELVHTGVHIIRDIMQGLEGD